MVLGKVPVSERLLIWIIVGQGLTALAVGAVGCCVDIFFSQPSFHFFLPLSGRRPDIDKNSVSRSRETKNNQTTKWHVCEKKRFAFFFFRLSMHFNDPK